jgi:NTP pyrophosphatase (non-canonical NTP hydrolase)
MSYSPDADTLTNRFSLAELQDYVRGMEDDRGFAHEDAARKALLLAEETGEALKAVRKLTGGSLDTEWTPNDLAEELADILIVTAALANRFDIDLEQAIRHKEAINRKRLWEYE